MKTIHNLWCVAVCAVLLCLLASCSTSTSVPKTPTPGAIAGCVFDLTAGPDEMRLVGANVFIPNVGPGVLTGTGGKFIITGLPPGRYDVTAMHPSVRRVRILGVRVAPDSVTLVRLGTCNVAIPEDPLPGRWEQSGSNMFPLKEFYTSGMIFTFECNP